MELSHLILLLPFAFALHNFEEVLGMAKWTRSISAYYGKPVTTRQFGIAVLLFTFLSFVITFTRSYYQNNYYYYVVVLGFSGMLFLNVFIPHVLATIFLRQYSPGVITGIFINLPLTTTILVRLKNYLPISSKQFFIVVILGGLVGVLLAVAFLKIGRAIDDFCKK